MDLGLGLDTELAGKLWVRITGETNNGCIVMGACYQCPDQEEINKAFFNHPNIFFWENASRHKKSRLLEHGRQLFETFDQDDHTGERCSGCHIYKQGRTDQGCESMAQPLSSMK